jgi:hypothetical protein
MNMDQTMQASNSLPVINSQVQTNISNPALIGLTQLAAAKANSYIVPIDNGVNNAMTSSIQSKVIDNSIANNTASYNNGQIYQNNLTKKLKIPQESEAANIRTSIWSNAGGLCSFADMDEISASEFSYGSGLNPSLTRFSNPPFNSALNRLQSSNRN